MSETVLVADDSQTIRQIVEWALKASQYEVVGVDSAQAAMQAANNAPSVILLDYYMPDGSGYDVCRELKGNAGTSGIPVIMLGGTYKNFDENLARQAGADAIVMKPFKTDALLNAIEEARSSASAGAAPQAPAAPAPPAAPEPAPTPAPAAPAFGQPAPQQNFGQPAQQPQPQPQPTPQYQQQPTPPPAPMPQAQPQPEAAPTMSDATPMPRTPTPAPSQGSQPRIATPDVNASSRQPTSAPAAPAATTSGSGTIGVGLSKPDLEKMIREEVRNVVKQELPVMLRQVMGETFQQKVLPKLVGHTEQRVEAMLNQRLESAIAEQVRIELERLLAE